MKSDRRIRIVFDGRVLVEKLTGAGKALAFLFRQLRQDFPAHEYLILSPVSRTNWRLRRQLFWEQVQFPWRAFRQRADILHAPGGTSAPIIRRGKLVMTVHDIAPTRHPELLPHWRSRWYWGKWVPFTARFADAILVPSCATKRDLVEVCRIRGDRIHVVPWGIPLEATDPILPAAAEKVRGTYRLPTRYLLYVGTIDRRKDYRTLLQALALLPGEISLVLAGTLIRGRTDFPQLVEQLDLKHRVLILGYVPDEDLIGLYRGATAFVYPSFYEGFGLPVLEAMACGTPVITYNTTSLPEVVGDAGILIDPPWTPEALAAQVRKILEDDAFRAELAGRGLDRAKGFDWRNTARLTLEVYKSLAG